MRIQIRVLRSLEEMKSYDYTIRRMRKDEVAIAIDWAAKEGWNPGLYDPHCFYKADPNGFFVGLLNGEPIGSISAVSYDNSFGFIGLYIVRPEFRKKGFGIQLWNTALEYLSGRNIGLDGVVGQQENYKKSGFRFAYRNIRFQGVGTGQGFTGPGTVRLSEVPFEQVATYDARVFPAPRHQFLNCWVGQPECAAFGILCRGQLSGYGVIRACRNGFKIGPLFANSSPLGEELFQALVGHAPPGSPVFFDTPEVNVGAVALARKNRMRKVFETARMYTKQAPRILIGRVFGVTSFELG